jgi:hypothetical protein
VKTSVNLNVVRDFVYDLVDKRLWPVAAALLIGLVAVPTVLSKPDPGTPVPPTPAATAGGPAPGSLVSLTKSAARAQLQAGGARDPFKQQHVASLTTNPTAIGPAPSGTAGFSGGGGGASLPSGGSVSAPTFSGPSRGSTPKRTSTAEARVIVDFGKATSKLTRYSVGRLTALPSTANPILVYMGLRKDGKTAVFLVSSDATPQGEGGCEPTKSICSTLTMRVGDSEFLDVTVPKGSVQYQLRLRSIDTP